MRIFKILIIILCSAFLFGQKNYVVINDTDTLTVSNFENINIQLDSLLKSSNEIGDQFLLKNISSDSILVYEKVSKSVDIDSLIFINSEIRKSVLNQIFKSLNGTKPFSETTKLFNTIITSSPSLSDNSELSFGIYQNDKIGALLDVKSNFNNYFSGLVGASRSDEQKWSVNGQMDIHLENQWRTAGIIDLHWKRLDEESQLLRFQYEEPHPFGLPIGVSASYNQDLREGNYVNTNSSIGIIKTIPGIGKLGFGGKNTKINTTTKGDSLGLADLSTQSVYLSGIIDYRNSYWLPSRGLYVSLYGDVGNRIHSDSSTVSFSTSIILEKYIPLFRRSNITLKLFSSGSWLNSGVLHTGELIRYGGANNLRGYVEDNFKSSWVAIPSIEFNFKLSTAQQIILFSDIAMQNEYKPAPFGYGIGFAQVTKNSVLKLFYGLGRGDTLKTGKVHLQFLTRL